MVYDTSQFEDLGYNKPDPNIERIESIQKKITGINDDLREIICGDSDDILKCKMDALESMGIFDSVDICNLLIAIKAGKKQGGQRTNIRA